MARHYSPEFEESVRSWAEAHIPQKRLDHVRGVVTMADGLAQQYAPDRRTVVRLAGWIHDVAKHLGDKELLQEAKRFNWNVTPIEKKIPHLLHGAISYFHAQEVFDLDDPELQSACALHTTGAPGMTITDKIVMLADAIEPNTRDYEGVEVLRETAQKDLDKAIIQLVERTLGYLIEKQQLIDPKMVDLRNELLEKSN